MGIWKDQSSTKQSPQADTTRPDRGQASESLQRQTGRRGGGESLIAADIAIDGKIEGSGHIRIAGRFNGEIDVRGDLTIEAGAKVTAGIRANSVSVAGELQGNIEAASQVELREGGVLLGDINAGSLIVAAGSRMRGQVEFGWEEKKPVAPAAPVRSGATAAA